MKTSPRSIVSLLVLVSGGAMAESALTPAAAGTGTASFMTEQQTYVGTYSTANKLISVDIDGLTYRGSYAPNAEDHAVPSSGAVTAKWGRAFLFASSAKTLQCKLDVGFPDASGQCLDADGKSYLVKAGASTATTLVR